MLGVAGVSEGQSASAQGANLTLIFEGEQRLFATRGADKCTIDSLTQTPLPNHKAGSPRRWQVSARGFCTAPATTIRQDARILISRFDFTTELRFAAEEIR